MPGEQVTLIPEHALSRKGLDVILTPWVVEHPDVQHLSAGTRWAYASLAAHADAHGAPDRTLADDLVARVARKQYRDNLTAAGLLEELPDGRWRVLAPRVPQEA